MNSYHDTRNTETPIGKGLLITAAAGIILFLLLQILIPLQKDDLDTDARPLLSKKEASEKASEAYLQLMKKSGRTINEAVASNAAGTANNQVIYYSNDLLSGYIDKEEAHSSYSPWEKVAPYDVYRVFLNDDTVPSQHTSIDIHMSTGHMVGFRTKLSSTTTDTASAPIDEILRRSDRVVEQLGYSLNQVVREPVDSNSSQEIHYRVPGAVVNEVTLQITLKWSHNQLVQLSSDWIIPESYTATMNLQKDKAETIQTYGYIVTSFILGLLSIILAIVFRKKARFGSATMWTLALLSCVISLLHLINMAPGAAMLSVDRAIPMNVLFVSIVFQVVITIVQGGITLYFSLVTGKYLWKQSPYPKLMLTWSDAGFGQRLVRAFWQGLLFAGIILGLQSLIFTLLDYGFDTWSSTDASMSPFNLSIPALYPLVAWVAAISEEAFFRLFGVGVLRKLLRNTWIAAIIPTMIWAAGHVTYSIFPFYSRIIELMIIGFLFVWIMVKYDFWTALFAHLMMDTLLMILSLLFEGTLAGAGLALLYLLLPVAVVYIIRYFHNKRRITNTPTDPVVL